MMKILLNKIEKLQNDFNSVKVELSNKNKNIAEKNKNQRKKNLFKKFSEKEKAELAQKIRSLDLKDLPELKKIVAPHSKLTSGYCEFNLKYLNNDVMKKINDYVDNCLSVKKNLFLKNNFKECLTKDITDNAIKEFNLNKKDFNKDSKSFNVNAESEINCDIKDKNLLCKKRLNCVIDDSINLSESLCNCFFINFKSKS